MFHKFELLGLFDFALLSDGKFLIADGLSDKRVVVRNADGSYHSEFGKEGTGPHQFVSLHSIAVGPDAALRARLHRD